MISFFATLTLVLPVFAIIGLGGLLRRLKLVDQSFLQQSNRLIYWVFLPLLLFYKIGTADFGASFNGAMVLGAMGALLLGALFSYLLAVLRGYPACDRGAFSQGAFRGNLAYIGLPMVLSAYGEAGFARAGMLLGCLVPLINLCSILVLALPHFGRQQSLRKTPWRDTLLYNPLIIGAATGLLWSYLALPLPEWCRRTLDLITAVTLPLALLTIGGSFSLRHLQGNLARAGLASACKLAGLPLLNMFVLGLLGVTGTDLGIALLMAGAPTAVASYIVAHELGGNARMAATIIVLSTLFSALSYTLLLLYLAATGLMPL